MSERTRFPSAPIGNAVTAALLAAYVLVAFSGPLIFGERGAPTTLIWPASGIGLALVLLRGIGVWPLIFVAALLRASVALQGGAAGLPVLVGSALLSGLEAALEPVLAAWLIWRIAGEAYFHRAGPFLMALLVATPVATFIATIPLIVGEFAGGLVTTHAPLGPIETWHAVAMSHLMAMLTLTPPIWLWVSRGRRPLTRRQVLELLALSSVAALALAVPGPNQPRYLLAGALLGMAFRLPLKWTAVAAALSSLVFLRQGMMALLDQPEPEIYLFFLQGITFVLILNIATYVCALLNREAHEREWRLNALVRELGSSERRERQRIAHMLHEHIQQLLVGASMALERLRLRGNAAAGDQAHKLIHEAIEAARTLAVGLHPPVLDSLGLAAAMDKLARDFDLLYGLRVHVQATDQDDPDMPDATAFLYHAARELLLNVVKHADTDEAYLRLRHVNGRLEVEVEDYGRGCDPDDLDGQPSDEKRHFGLFSIRRRVELLGGRFEVSADHGCRITLAVPIVR